MAEVTAAQLREGDRIVDNDGNIAELVGISRAAEDVGPNKASAADFRFELRGVFGYRVGQHFFHPNVPGDLTYTTLD
ncbi:hypothetical protein AXK56_22570 [Tsukamurella pulmonis]|uniref:Uncharacterized protein n=1 Tax=Tsukamurella pulmonis TaxID=47312 RepID=A0A1H1AD45_9ACTN|nr:hypothetical protein [Tsukamurella pulmonis]KXO92792.1 hypothetical protein AXK56_22570 [Tsukamurella pulmonis]SDQ37559.1 hypothetical protein SAMN04489765_0166 [Tsukamurella pulmonis]SUQ39370.1 Uncharacterised protein [Tsukamurella pulmonis]